VSYIEHICLAIVTVAVSFLVIECGLLVRDWRAESAVVARQAQATLLDYSRFSQDATGVTAEMRSTLKSVRKANEETARNSARATATLNADLEKFGKVLDQTSYAVENIDMITDALGHQASDVLSDAHGAIRDAQPAIANFNRAAAGAADAMNDSAIRATLANVEQTSQQVVGIATDAHTETSLIVGQTKKAFEPKNKFWSILQLVIGQTINGAALYYYLSH
jgi:hypothetical protein